jgi:predicted RNase H-related nuclease YkuK (DUF458 family)
MATTETIGEDLTFEKVWAAIQATNEQIKANGEQMRETIKAISEQMKETDRQIGRLSNRFGETLEYLVVPNLVAKFKALGFQFEKAHRDTKIENLDNRVVAEIDVFLENGDRAMVVETKVKPSTRDIDEHVERMEKLRSYADSHNDRRVYLGAMAGVDWGHGEKTYALKTGFYVIVPSGDTFEIIEPRGDYHPHEW